jgi:hypothetical protein
MLKQNVFSLFLILITLTFITSCGDDDTSPAKKNLEINISGLQDLGSNYNYEGWIIVEGSPISTGLFSVDASGTLSQNIFEISADDLEAATTFVVSIEPIPDNDPAPSSVKILGGDFNGNSTVLSVNHGAALGTDFSSASGGYILATPTNGANTDELSGVWWLDPSAGPGVGLELPTLPSGWNYEGWAVIDGTPVSTGTFTSASGIDAADTFSGTEPGPPFPGEDFLLNAPMGLTFPTDLTNSTIVISVEPSPDNSTAPFLLKPLVGTVPSAAIDHTYYNMNNNAGNTNPTGTVNK